MDDTRSSRVITNSAAWAWNRRSFEADGAVDRIPEEPVPEVVVALVDVVERVEDRRLDHSSMAPRSRRWTIDHPGDDIRLKQRPTTAAARATAWRRPTAGRAVQGRRRRSCRAPCFADPPASPLRLSSSAPSSPSMWSGIPFVRAWTASTTSRGAGSSRPRMSVVATPVSPSVSGRRRAFSAWR